MKKAIAWMSAGVLSLGYALAAQGNEMSGATEKAVAALEEQWAQAQRTNNIDMESPMLAEKFAVTESDGSVTDRQQFIANERATKYTSVTIEDLQVTAFHDTAVARALITYKGTDQKGQPIDSHDRWTDTWAKMPDGKWQCVASAGSPMRKK
jgi:ketosteroid isomerase-like protein